MRRMFAVLLLSATLSTEVDAQQSADLPPSDAELMGWVGRAGALTGFDVTDAKIIERAARRLEHLETSMFLVKLSLPVTNEIRALCFDAQGDLVDGRALVRADADARLARFSRLDPDLASLLETLTGEATVRVACWLRATEPVMPERPAISSNNRVDATPETLREQAKDLRRRATMALEAQVPAVQTGFLTTLAELGLTPDYVSAVAPLIYVTATRAQITTLAQHADVDAIYGPHENRDLLGTAKQTHKVDVVDAWNIQGSFVEVGIVEDSRVQFLNPNLVAGVTRVPADPNVDQHATACAGIVASQHAVAQGFAQSSPLFSANATSYDDDDLAAAIDWAAATQNLDVINNSWGFADSQALNEHDRHYDYVVRFLWSTSVCAAGNDGGGCDSGNDRVNSPGKAFNVITCGGLNDGGTVTWDDDTMYNCSSWLDPSTGAEKPEVVASGASITSTTDVFPWTGPVGSGTSYASPMVAGIAALVMDSLNNYVYPELYKAIILATALHNIEGASRLSELDGAGGVDARAAVQLALDGIHDWREVTAAQVPYSVNVFCEGGELIRAAICWDSHPNGDYSTDPLEADLDLDAFHPDGSNIAFSASFFNPFEIVEFVAPISGMYEFRVTDFSFDGDSEFVGLAVWTGNKKLLPDLARTFTEPPVAEHNLLFNSQPFWNVAAIRPATADYDLALVTNSAWSDPADYAVSALSSYGAGGVDYVLVDRNHAPAGAYHLAVTDEAGAGSYVAEHGAHIADITSGSYGPYVMAAGEIVKIFDASFTAGVTKYVSAVPDSGDANLALYLYDSDPAVPSSQLQARDEFVAFATSGGGAGATECFQYSASATDWLGLVVVNLGATEPTPFMLYADTSAPTGSLAINGGAAQTGLNRVVLNINVLDAQTDVRRMRIRNVPAAFGAWQSFASVGEWDLAAGTGNRTVEIEVENHACMTALFADTIAVYACPAAGAALANGNFADATGYPWCFADESENGFVTYADGAAQVRGGNDGVSGFTYTFITQGVTLPAGFYNLSFDWSYSSFNQPDFDGACYDLVNVATGQTLIGGPQVLSDTSGESGSRVQAFLSSPPLGLTVEVRLGAFSFDNLFGPGTATFDNVVIAPQPCAAITDLVCVEQNGIAHFEWQNAGIYSNVRVARDGVTIATLPGAQELYTDFSAPAGAHTYLFTAVCPPGVDAAGVSCALTVSCTAVSGLVCASAGSDVVLSWGLADSYTGITVRRDGLVIASLAAGAVGYTDVSPPAGNRNYDVIASCGAGLAAPTVSCVVSVPCDGVSALSCTAMGADVSLAWNLGESYAQIRVRRNAVTIATLAGGATTYFDVAPPAGSLTYEVIGDCAVGLAAPAAMCTISSACDAVSALSCGVAGDNIVLSWSLGDAYTQIEITRDGVLLTTLAGGALNFTDVAPPAGAHSYIVTAACGGVDSAGVGCVATAPCLAVSALSCAFAADDVQLAWQLGDAYTELRVMRDGALIATLGGAAVAYTDNGVLAGQHTYAVTGECAPGASAPAASCVVTVGCDPVAGLSCSVTGEDVGLTWALAGVYTEILVLRDGILIASLSGLATSTTDVGVAPGGHSYTVSAACGGLSSADSTCLVQVGAAAAEFLRGDCNVSGSINIADAVAGLNWLFVPGTPAPTCTDACDVNDDGLLNIADMIYLLNALFAGGPQPPEPGDVCGPDPTPDAAGCVDGAVCP